MRAVWLSGYIDKEKAEEVCEEIIELIGEDREKPIALFINSGRDVLD